VGRASLAPIGTTLFPSPSGQHFRSGFSFAPTVSNLANTASAQSPTSHPNAAPVPLLRRKSRILLGRRDPSIALKVQITGCGALCSADVPL